MNDGAIDVKFCSFGVILDGSSEGRIADERTRFEGEDRSVEEESL
jgi:hypothetical protein